MATFSSETLVVGGSATALLDLAEADRLLLERKAIGPVAAIVKYRKYILDPEDVVAFVSTGLNIKGVSWRFQ